MARGVKSYALWMIECYAAVFQRAGVIAWFVYVGQGNDVVFYHILYRVLKEPAIFDIVASDPVAFAVGRANPVLVFYCRL